MAKIKVFTNEEVCAMEEFMEACGLNLDYVDAPYTDGTFKTAEEKNQCIVEAFMSEIEFIQEFEGEYANEYNSRYEYVERGAFEKDYFASWLESCSDYPTLIEIQEFCEAVGEAIKMWLYAVERGYIEPNADWKYTHYEENLKDALAAAMAIIAERQHIVDDFNNRHNV